ncbi:glycoside hydrolase family 61 protein F [Desarmillaria ectypa]|nr:glycoside hydrolase family 61 protein F [Desarmillaria ectypa]
MFKATLVASLLVSIASVRGHSHVETIVADGTEYNSYLPYSDPYCDPVPDRIVRPIPGNVETSECSIQCNGYTAGGYNTAPAPIYGTVAAGSKVALNWTTWPDSHKGPMITYMARTPNNIGITAWSPATSAVWFKVAESGKTSAGLWAATDLLKASNSVYTFTIPSSLKAGQYIIRHEIYPGAQFYPSCIQVQVTGSGTAYPTSFVSFPGAYTASTPGIVYDVYPIPGPAVWTG